MRKITDERKEELRLALAVLALIFLFDGILIYREYRNYEEKFEIISYLSKEGSLENAAALFKGEADRREMEEAKRLKSYGYAKEADNIYLSGAKQNAIYIILESLVLYVLMILGYQILQKVKRKRQKKVFDQLGDIIADFRSGSYEIPPKLLFMAEEDAGIYGELESLGDLIKILRSDMLREKEGTKSLVTDISHQLKTPVSALKACYEILQQDLSKEEREEFLQRLGDQLKGMENLLASLLNISRMETGMIELKKEYACAFDTFAEAVNRVYMKAEVKMIGIQLEAEDHLRKIKVMHDRKWLCEAFINILENAVKYSSMNTEITVRFQERVSFLRIEIEDQGIGIPVKEYHQIFKRFYRGSAAAVSAVEGSGIGLYLTREILTRHCGMVTVSGAKNRKGGSCFVLQIPFNG